jgi:hypothetical protein
MPIQWRVAETDFLVNERRYRNDEFHSMPGRSRVEFWESVVRRIYRRFYFDVTARQCETKWVNLVRDYNVSK